MAFAPHGESPLSLALVRDSDFSWVIWDFSVQTVEQLAGNETYRIEEGAYEAIYDLLYPVVAKEYSAVTLTDPGEFLETLIQDDDFYFLAYDERGEFLRGES